MVDSRWREREDGIRTLHPYDGDDPCYWIVAPSEQGGYAYAFVATPTPHRAEYQLV